MRTIDLIAGALLLLAATQAAAACKMPVNVDAMATEVTRGMNLQRNIHSVGYLTHNPELSKSAANHACDMALNGFFAHKGSDGANVQARARRRGYTDCIIAENLAWGFRDPQRIVRGWMESPGHRRNMLHNRMTEFGIGIVQGRKGPIWVLVLAKPC